MKRKQLKINWDELESAFDNRREDLIYYLDLVTGQVVLEGEGEEAEFEDDKDLMEEEGEGDSLVRDGTTRLYIEPPGEDEELGWMEDFVEEAEDLDPALRDRLLRVLDESNALDAFREALRTHPAERDRWFSYRAERVHERIDAWLDANRVHAAEQPPWRS